MGTLAQWMNALDANIEGSSLVAVCVLIASFAVLAKCADLFVESAVAVATRFGLSKLVIGIVLVSFATTMPELAVSFMAALRGNPEMALGNAVGSVIVDDGFGMAMAGIFALAPIAVMPKVLKTSGIFLVLIQILAFVLIVGDQTLSQIEGLVLVLCFCGYLWYLFRLHRNGELNTELEADEPEAYTHMPMGRIIGLFILGLAGILISSEFIVSSATSIAHALHIPNAVIALTLVALGTSIPEIATCIMAARKGHGEIAIGNIIGADILNICWVAGASAMAHDLSLSTKQIWFMFPTMFVIVGVMLLLLRWKYELTRRKGFILFGLYIAYAVGSFIVFPPNSAP